MPFWVTNIKMNQTALYLMPNEAKICNESESYSVKPGVSCQYKINCCVDISTEDRRVTRKLDLDQTSMAYKHTERNKRDKTHFSVRPHDFLHLSPTNSALYVLLCLFWSAYADFSCRLSYLLAWVTTELVAHFDLALCPYIYFRVIPEFQIISSLTVYHL